MALPLRHSQSENRVTLGASWSACAKCAVEGHSAVLASADRDRGTAVSAERELVDSNTCKSTRPCFRHGWTQGPRKCYQTCFSPLVSFPFSFAFASLMLKPRWSLDAPGSQSGGSERVQGAGSGAGLQSESLFCHPLGL